MKTKLCKLVAFPLKCPLLCLRPQTNFPRSPSASRTRSTRASAPRGGARKKMPTCLGRWEEEEEGRARTGTGKRERGRSLEVPFERVGERKNMNDVESLSTCSAETFSLELGIVSALSLSSLSRSLRGFAARGTTSRFSLRDEPVLLILTAAEARKKRDSE